VFDCPTLVRAVRHAKRRAILLALLGLLSVVGLDRTHAAGRPDPPPVRLCKALLPAFVGSPQALAVELRWPGPAEPAAVRLSWPPDGFLVCRFLPLDKSFGAWQLDVLDSSRFGRLDRYEILQLHKLLRPPVEEVEKRASRSDRPGLLRHLLHAAQQAIAAAGLASVYGLLAIGFSLSLAVGGVFNLAYGLFYTVGAFQAWLAFLAASLLLGGDWLWLGLPLLALGLAAGAAAGLLSARVSIPPPDGGSDRRRAGIVVSLGLLIAGAEALRLLQGPETYWRPYRDGAGWILWEAAGYKLTVAKGQVAILLLTSAGLALFAWLLHRTGLGRRLRAVADDPGAAALLGIDVGRCVGLAWAVGGALAAAAGGFAFLAFGAVNFHLGAVIGFKALTAAILGGIGNPFGAILGALGVAAVEVAMAAGGMAAWKDAAIFLLLVTVLVFRPQGLLGRPRESSPQWARTPARPL